MAQHVMAGTRTQLSGRPNGIGSSNGGGLRQRETSEVLEKGERETSEVLEKGERETSFMLPLLTGLGPKHGHIWVHLRAGRNSHGPATGSTGQSNAWACRTAVHEVQLIHWPLNAVVKTAKGYITSPLHGFVVWYSPVVTLRTASSTFTNSTFCPHSVFVCFVWISEQTAIISLYNIN
jgi:hypothetical protein